MFKRFNLFHHPIIFLSLIPIIYWCFVDILYFLLRFFEAELGFITILFSLLTSIAAYIFLPILLIIKVSKSKQFNIKKPLKIFFAIWMSFIYILHFQPISEDTNFLATTKGAGSNISNYLKASKSYLENFGQLPNSSSDLGNYVDILGCEKSDFEFCKSLAAVNYSKAKKNSWYTVLGDYQIQMKNGIHPISNEKYLLIKATPTQKRYSHLKIEGCHYLASGQIKVRDIDYFMHTNPILLLRYLNFYEIPFRTNSNDFCSS